MNKKLVPAAFVTVTILLSIQLLAQEISPARGIESTLHASIASASTPPANTVAGGVLLAWGATSIWDAMSTNWQNFGSIPVSVDDSTYVHSDFTYQDLVNSGADVMVISDPAGVGAVYSQAEIQAVGKYAEGGHNVIGTYAVFQYGGTDNRGLAPIFGLSASTEFNTSEVGISNLFKKLKPIACLLNGIPGSSWQSQGYAFTQVPASGTWIGHGGKDVPIAESDKGVGGIGLYTASTYTSVYISNFPEYFGGTDDEQLLYNAVTCYVQ